MQNPKNAPSIFGKSLNWIANHTYRRIPTLMNSYQRRTNSPKKLSFEDYILTPQLARQAGLMYVRQLRRNYLKQKQGIIFNNTFIDIQKVISQYKSNTDLLKQKPHELLCPICLQLFSGPVTTSCNHTFCRMCIDESILFNPSCPSCRKNIRAQELIVSKATQAIIRMLLYKLDTEEVQKFVKKQLQYQEWLQKRTPKRSQLHKGQIIDVRDTQHVWCKGSIIEILPQNVTDPEKYEYLLVHYEGWASRFDEVISLQSLRLATCGFYMSRYEIPHYNLDPNNPEHYRCPVVTGPPQPVIPIVPQPIDNDDMSSNPNISLSQPSDQHSYYSGINNLFEPQLLSQSRSRSQNSQGNYLDLDNINVFFYANDLYNNNNSNSLLDDGDNDNERNDHSESIDEDQQLYYEDNFHLFQHHLQQHLQRIDNDNINEIIYPSSQPCDKSDNVVNQIWQKQIEMMNRKNFIVNNQRQRQQQQQQVMTLRRDHSLPYVRHLSQLSSSQFGNMVVLIKDSNFQQNQQQQQLIIKNNNSQIDQQIINQINLQSQQQNQLQTNYEQLSNLNNFKNNNRCQQKDNNVVHSQNLLLVKVENQDNPEFKIKEKITNDLYEERQQQLMEEIQHV